MTVKIGNENYRNVDKIEDMQTRKIAVSLTFYSGETKDIPVTENDEIIFALKETAEHTG